jgi:hypothetical protein
MVIALVCYAVNVYPELPIIGEALDRVVRHMIRNLPTEQMSSYLESILPDVQRILDSRKYFMPLSKLIRFDQEIHSVELLEVFSEEINPSTRGRIRPRTIEVDVHSSRKRRKLS